MGCLFFLPFLGGVHLFDWDEINFAELAREMLVTGDWLQMQINFERFTEKPPLFFWFQALCMKLFGVGEYAARLPNAILGIIVLPYLYVSGKFLLDRKFGFLWALSWFGSILPFLYFKSGIIDPLFNFLIFNGIFFLIHFIWKNRNEANVYFSKSSGSYLWLAGISVGLAVLTKGPVAYLIIFLTVLSYWLASGLKTIISALAFLRFSLIALGVFLLWFALDAALHGPDFIIEFTIRQWELLTKNDAGHGGFPGYHFVVLLFGCFPASIFALRGLGRVKGVKLHIVNFQRWMITLLLVILILFSIVNTKIVHYSSLAYYPLTFLSALALWQFIEFPRSYKKWLSAMVAVIGFLAVFISAALPWAGMNIEELKPLFEKDAFAMANLDAKVHWQIWDYTPALVLLLVIGLYLVMVRKNKAFAFRSLFMGMALWCMLALVFFIGKIERISQHASVEFFSKYANEEVYVTTYGYKSYVPWFYNKISPYENERANEKEWLYHGATDRDVLISTKITKTGKLESEIPDAVLLYAKNGFYFYKRPAAVK